MNIQAALRKQIEETIPPGSPHSIERREWCKAAHRVIASVLLEHANGDPMLALTGFDIGYVTVRRELLDGALTLAEETRQ